MIFTYYSAVVSVFVSSTTASTVSGTTSVTAKKLGRHYIGIEREKEYAAIAEKRLEDADINRTIQGFENGIFKARNFTLQLLITNYL